MARQGAGGTAAQGHGWPGGPVTQSPAYHRVRWTLAATHALTRYGVVGNIAALGPPGRTDDRAHMARSGAAGQRGWAPLASADDYQRHYRTEVSGHLRAVSGFRGAHLLRRDHGTEVMFTSITFFTSLDAIRGFAGDDFEPAVIEDAARQPLSRWDERVSHHEVVAELE